LSILRWNLIAAILFVSMGCSTTNIDWEEASHVDTVKAYQQYLQKHPNSPYSEQAQIKLETYYYQNAKDDGTVIGYSNYLAKNSHGTHTRDIRAKLIAMRCQDTDFVKVFPSWLIKGQPSDPNRHASWFLDNSYIGISPGDIGRGYKAACDDPEYPLELEWGVGHLILFSGRGVIVGPDGVKVLVGYPCK
jgi:hypothetical protein